MNLKERYEKIREGIAAAAAKSRRDPKDVTLLAVTKNGSPDQIKQLVELGHRDFAESKVQQLQQRAAQLDEWLLRQQGKTDKKLPQPADIHWHMIGHLQRNKVRPVISICHAVHSVDSLRLAEEIQDEAERLQRIMPVFLEVNVAGENSKFGVAVGASIHLAEQIDTMDNVHIVGVMCMAPYSANPEDARPVFVRLREIFEEVKFRKIGADRFKHLSMGMSGDYQVAVEEGATMVRVGSALFGS
jgi:pyridoxal phosphate enzyme (YggS family)